MRTRSPPTMTATRQRRATRVPARARRLNLLPTPPKTPLETPSATALPRRVSSLLLPPNRPPPTLLKMMTGLGKLANPRRSPRRHRLVAMLPKRSSPLRLTTRRHRFRPARSRLHEITPPTMLDSSSRQSNKQPLSSPMAKAKRTMVPTRRPRRWKTWTTATRLQRRRSRSVARRRRRARKSCRSAPRRGPRPTTKQRGSKRTATTRTTRNPRSATRTTRRLTPLRRSGRRRSRTLGSPTSGGR
mmetsp:Transcript_7921/g.24679  ORF Transcript_7921/g.24679 Transcript_7921/m.24679 type:complete len:244 (-) Transcript_7921:73-804(-)